MVNSFVWADLSTYNTTTSMAFYREVFGWEFHDADGYHVAMQGDFEVVGVYETPDFFKKIKMPHFWMSYIAVENALATAELVKEFGDAKVELTTEFYGGNIALIRDPQGAGFTVYDGGKLNSRSLNPDRLVWNELHVSDASSVMPFYERLFGWTILESTANRFGIYNSDQQHISDIAIIPNKFKGKYEYWVCTFGVDDLEQAKENVLRCGGGIVMDEGQRVMVNDNSKEAFFYIQ